MSFASNNDGADEGIKEHKSALKDLLAEEKNLLIALANDNFDEHDQRRLDEIHKEMAYRKSEIKKLT